MLSKFFVALLAVSTAVLAFFGLYSWSWLKSIGSPRTAVAGYEYHAAYYFVVLLGASALLLLIANVVLWTTRNSWAMWATLVYFAFFVLIKYLWLDQALYRFRQDNDLTDSVISLGPFLGVIFVIAAGVVVFLNQLIVLRLRRKMYPEPATAIDSESGDQASAE